MGYKAGDKLVYVWDLALQVKTYKPANVYYQLKQLYFSTKAQGVNMQILLSLKM